MKYFVENKGSLLDLELGNFFFKIKMYWQENIDKAIWALKPKSLHWPPQGSTWTVPLSSGLISCLSLLIQFSLLPVLLYLQHTRPTSASEHTRPTSPTHQAHFCLLPFTGTSLYSCTCFNTKEITSGDWLFKTHPPISCLTFGVIPGPTHNCPACLTGNWVELAWARVSVLTVLRVCDIQRL